MGASNSLPSSERLGELVFLKLHNAEPRYNTTEEKVQGLFATTDTDGNKIITRLEFRQAAANLKFLTYPEDAFYGSPVTEPQAGLGEAEREIDEALQTMATDWPKDQRRKDLIECVGMTTPPHVTGKIAEILHHILRLAPLKGTEGLALQKNSEKTYQWGQFKAYWLRDCLADENLVEMLRGFDADKLLHSSFQPEVKELLNDKDLTVENATATNYAFSFLWPWVRAVYKRALYKQVCKVEQAFDLFDTNADGSISLQEVIALFTVEGRPKAPGTPAPSNISPRKRRVQKGGPVGAGPRPAYWSPEVERALEGAKLALEQVNNGSQQGGFTELASFPRGRMFYKEGRLAVTQSEKSRLETEAARAVLYVCAGVAYLNPQKAKPMELKRLLSYATSGGDDAALWEYCLGMLSTPDLFLLLCEYDKEAVSGKPMVAQVKRAMQMVSMATTVGGVVAQSAVGEALLVWLEAVLGCVMYSQLHKAQGGDSADLPRDEDGAASGLPNEEVPEVTEASDVMSTPKIQTAKELAGLAFLLSILKAADASASTF
jgi:Ca2+-binding EF-hand superfamily protein